MLTLVFCVIFVALAFEFINGFHDTANAIATDCRHKSPHAQHKPSFFPPSSTSSAPWPAWRSQKRLAGIWWM
jgi:PiT family inorganic phosphate transporter